MDYMINDGIKLALAGLMVVLDIFGISSANQVVLNQAEYLGISDSYEIVVDKSEVESKTDVQLINIKVPVFAPYTEDYISMPYIEALSAVVMDIDTSSILYEKDINSAKAMASTTKLMTAVVALENLDADEIIKVDYQDTTIEPMKMYLTPGEKISVDALMHSLLINSNNDAALVLARAGGNGDPSAFIDMMNQKAILLGLNNTHFANPHGLDQAEHYSSAKDLALLARHALKSEYISSIVSMKNATVNSENGSVYYLKTTNKLLDSYLDIRGVKTGFTDNAGQVVILKAVNDEGNEIVTVVMNSPDRFQESKSLIDWTFDNYYWD